MDLKQTNKRHIFLPFFLIITSRPFPVIPFMELDTLNCYAVVSVSRLMAKLSPAAIHVDL